jgi:DNA repair exonuclease SbcCD ATPase subunit
LIESDKSKGKNGISPDLYYYVVKLGNDLKDSERKISELVAENKTLKRLLKTTEDDLLKLHSKNNMGAEEMANVQNIITLENKIKELTNNMQALKQENNTLLRIQEEKTNVIKTLTDELNNRGATDEYVQQLNRELQDKNNLLEQYLNENR